jgi:Ca2+-binding RTX toxin-like protein
MATPTTSGDYSLVPVTGYQFVDALLYGTCWYSSTITYSFPNASSLWSTDPTYGYGPSWGDQEPWSVHAEALGATEASRFTAALQTWSNVADLHFVLVADNASTVGDIRVEYSELDPDAQAWAYAPNGTPYGGDIWINYDSTSYHSASADGSYPFITFIHEIGHALGLKHSFGTSSYNTVTMSGAYADLDSVISTVMSYSADPGDSTTYLSYNPTTPMVYDIMAIQYLYGENTSYNLGDTTYSFSTSSKYLQTIWDAGGTDTIACSGTGPVNIDLNEGSGSRIGSAVYVLDQYGSQIYAVDNVWIAFGASIENATGGSGNDSLTGNELNNVLNGGFGNDSLVGDLGNDTLLGGFGSDTLQGNAGDDVYNVDSLLDRVIEIAGGGVDRVETSLASYTLGTEVENLTYTSAGAFVGTGNALANSIVGSVGSDTLGGGAGDDTLVGNIGSDRLNGGVGNDRMVGGMGDDVYVVDAVGDVLVETLFDGFDRVETDLSSYTLGAEFESLLYTGAGSFTGTGNAVANSLVGGAGNDTLSGGAGNDTLSGNAGNDQLDGGAGNDALTGGAGNDSYVVEAVGDVITEFVGEGADQVDVRFALAGTFALAANVENATIGNTTAGVNLSGNDVANILTGNASANILDGGAGADTLTGGSGDDIYLVDNAGDNVAELAAGGGDLVKVNIAAASGNYTLTDNVENATLINVVAYSLSGNALDNVLTGNAAANSLTGGLGNDSLDGGAGADALMGGAGNDTYVVDVAGDIIIETAGEGTDQVNVAFMAAGTYVLSANLEHATMINAMPGVNLTGNAANNSLTGNVAANILDGGAGADTLIGGLGNDTYLIDNAGDLITESSALLAEIDLVQSAVDYTLGANLENLTLTGAAAHGTGNALNNLITGNAGDNLLGGGGGDDILLGGGGNDTVDGGVGTDTYTVSGLRTDYRFERSSLTEVRIIHNATGETDTLTGIERVRFGNAIEAQLTLDDLLANTASPFADSYTGGDLSNDSFDGLAGNDSISGLGGNDSLYGGADNDSLTGGAGNDFLDGGTGADVMSGGSGNDTYLIDDVGDTVTENANEGIDTLRTVFNTTLTTHLENLTLLGAVLTGTGNTSANQLLGNANNNLLTGLDGNDTLDGGTGADTLIGGTGDDTYTMDNLGDVITENAGEGNDTLTITIQNFGAPIILTAPANIETILFAPGSVGVVLATSGSSIITGSAGIDSVAFTGGGTYTLPTGIENLQLTQSTGNIGGTGGAENNLLEGNNGANILDGGAGNDTLKGYAGEDILLGGTGNDRLDGGKGGDRMEGGTGDDTYSVDNANDQIVEAAASGIDTVRSWLKNTTLGDNLENLILEGTAKANGTGNDLANSITGNIKANILTGGAGADTFIFTTALGPLNVDTLTDFTTGSDKIALDDAIFGSLSGGWFHSVTSLAQTDADDHILYDQSTGALYYDADGSGGAAAVRFAMLSGAPAVSAADLLVV